MVRTKINLDENDMPTRWYNILPDLPAPLDPPLHPATGEPVTFDDLEPIFAKELILQETSSDRYIPIPEEVMDVYRIWRPNPLRRAVHLERYLKTPARIYFKYEGESPIGSHKANSSVPQVYYNMKQGVENVTTETGAGQWGCALAYACNYFNVGCKVFMVRSSFEQKPYRKTMIHLWNGQVFPSPSPVTAYGRKVLSETPETPGTLGIAISEAIEEALNTPGTRYTLGSVLNHVMLHQTIIGQEAKKQFDMIEDYPDYVIACCGGGSNFAGLAFPFVKDKIEKSLPTEIIGVEPASCPTLTQGRYTYDLGDSAGMTPRLKMFTLGHDFVPPVLHAGGLRYHGMSPIVSRLAADGIMKAEAYSQRSVLQAGQIFAQTEGIVPAPESCHAIRSVIEKAMACRTSGEAKSIVFNLSGHGFIDMHAYDKYLGGGA